jgi:small-conductance mechanosensitive channel
MPPLSSYALDIPPWLEASLTQVGWSALFLLLVWIAGRRLDARLSEEVEDINARHKLRKLVQFGRAFVAFTGLALIWAPRVQNLGVFFGILGAGLTLSIQESLMCVAGWIFVLASRPYDVGDRIEIDGQLGDVIDIHPFATTLLEVGRWVRGDHSTGRILTVPNSMVFRNVVHNYSYGFPFLWDELEIVVTFESDWQRAKEILLEAGQAEAGKLESEVRRQLSSAQRRFPIQYRQISPYVFSSIADHGVSLSLRYLCPVRARRTFHHAIVEGFLVKLAEEAEVDLAYPTTRMFRNNQEGKVHPEYAPASLPPGLAAAPSSEGS